jgi:hypothetical protein
MSEQQRAIDYLLKEVAALKKRMRIMEENNMEQSGTSEGIGVSVADGSMA